MVYTSVEQSFQNYEPISVNWTLLKYYELLIQIGPRELAKIHLNSLEALRPLVEAPFFVACIACAISIPSTPMPPMASFCSTAKFLFQWPTTSLVHHDSSVTHVHPGLLSTYQ